MSSGFRDSYVLFYYTCIYFIQGSMPSWLERHDMGRVFYQNSVGITYFHLHYYLHSPHIVLSKQVH